MIGGKILKLNGGPVRFLARILIQEWITTTGQESALGEELHLKQGDTLVYTMEHDENIVTGRWRWIAGGMMWAISIIRASLILTESSAFHQFSRLSLMHCRMLVDVQKAHLNLRYV